MAYDVAVKSSMVAVLLMTVLVVPPLLVAVLKRTSLFWLPGAALIASSLAVVIVWPFETGHDEASVMNGIANFVHLVIGGGLFVFGAICWIVAARLHARATRTRS
ncbi:MAG: hypothetical protein ABI467_12525 [Kofleriaceae bacterium]